MTIKLRHLFIKDIRPYVSSLQNSRIDLVLWGAIIGWGIVLTWLSIARYEGYNADMFDLGNMAQAIASVQRGEPLVFTYSSGQMSRLALHVEFIYFILALPYMLWPDPRLLLIIQAALYALGALPVYSLAARRLNSIFAARCVALIYLFYPIVQTSVLLDIHGETLAMPLLVFALNALDRRSWRSYGLFILLALSCKFYVAVPVAILGVIIWWYYRETRVGVWTTGAGLMYGLLTFFVIRPLFTQTSEVHRGINYLSFYFGELHVLQETLGWRLANAAVVFGPALFVMWRGWVWLLPGLLIGMAALLSTREGSAGYASHHYALVAPFIIRATIDGVERLQQQASNISNRGRRNWRGDLGLTLAIVILFNIALVDTPLNPQFWMGLPARGIDPSGYGITSRDQMKDRFLADKIPPDAPLAVSLHLAPHLVNREILYLVRYEVGQEGRSLPDILPQVDYVLTDALFDFRIMLPNGEFDGGATSELQEIGYMLRNPDFGLVAARDGLLLFQHDAPDTHILEQHVEEIAAPNTLTTTAQFGEYIGLVDATITPRDHQRLRATFTWQRTATSTPAHYVAISQLEGVADMRIVHLPTYALLPTSEWQPDQVVRETFDVELPDNLPPGNYTWKTSWYDLSHSEAYATDMRSRLPNSDAVSIDTITIPQP